MRRILSQGFSLIELLVVISIIGILSTLVMANLNSARERGRDVQRKSDLRNIQTALRLYYNDKAGYPQPQVLPDWGSQWTDGSVVYMNILPADPLADQSYRYIWTDSETYTLSACLENKSDEKGQITQDTDWCPSGWMYQVKP